MTGPDSEGRRSVPDSSQTELERLREEVGRLEAERAELEARLAHRPPEPGPRTAVRRTATVVLAGLCCVLIFLSAITVWVHQTVIRTNGFVEAVGPIVDRPAVTQAVGAELTSQIFTVLDVEHRVEQVLPSQAHFMAVPLTSAVQTFVEDQTVKVLRSPQFRTLWIAVLRAAHSELIAALRGHGQVLTTSNGAVVLNVLPLVDRVLQQLQSTASGILGRNISIPSVTNTELPAQIRTALSNSLGVQLPADFAQIELARSGSIDMFNQAVQLIDVLFWLLPVLTVLCIGATLWLSPSRRRTLLEILVGTALTLIVEERATSWIQSRVIASLDPSNRAAGSDIIRQFLGDLVTVTWLVVISATVMVVVLLLAGPYPWARRARRLARRAADEFGRAFVLRTGEPAAASWVASHYRAAQVAGAVVGGLLLWAAPGWWFFVVAAALVLYESAVSRAGKRNAVTADAVTSQRPTQPPDAAGSVGTAS